VQHPTPQAYKAIDARVRHGTTLERRAAERLSKTSTPFDARFVDDEPRRRAYSAQLAARLLLLAHDLYALRFVVAPLDDAASRKALAAFRYVGPRVEWHFERA
jgi:hypothetical protein